MGEQTLHVALQDILGECEHRERGVSENGQAPHCHLQSPMCARLSEYDQN